MNELTEQELDAMRWMDDQGIGFLPEDKSHLAYRRDYCRENNAFIGVINGVILSAVLWLPVLVYLWRTR